jgi:cell filamentation protein
VTYEAIDDPYCYAGTLILKNRARLRDQAALDRFEAISFAQRAEEMLPFGDLSSRHFLAVHRHLFQDVYRWAGKPRTIRLHKDESTFCYPEHIRIELGKLFEALAEEGNFVGLPPEAFAARLAHFLAEMNAIHAFREGNGRTQLAFAQLLANRAGHPLHLEALDPEAFLGAMICSFRGDEASLRDILSSLL